MKDLKQTSNAFPVTVVSTAPGIVTLNQSGVGPAVVGMYDQNGVYKGTNSAQSPAQKGWILAIYLTGEGKVTPQPADGAVITVVNGTTPVQVFAPTVRIDENPSTVIGYGEVSGLVNGVLQLNAIVPQGVRSGPVSLSVGIGNGATQANVTVQIQ